MHYLFNCGKIIDTFVLILFSHQAPSFSLGIDLPSPPPSRPPSCQPHAHQHPGRWSHCLPPPSRILDSLLATLYPSIQLYFLLVSASGFHPIFLFISGPLAKNSHNLCSFFSLSFEEKNKMVAERLL